MARSSPSWRFFPVPDWWSQERRPFKSRSRNRMRILRAMPRHITVVRAVACAAVLCVAVRAVAATSTVWELNGYQDFLRGRISGLSLTRDGRLVPGPKLDAVYSSDQPQIWAIAEASD